MRCTAEHISQWREQGFVIIDNFFTPEEYAPVVADFDTLYADAGIRLNHDCPGQINQMPRQTQSSYATLNREKVAAI